MQYRGFSRPVGAYQRYEFAVVDGKGNTFYRMYGAIIDVDVLYFKHCFSSYSPR
ncbi:hypothetical protein SDC9_198835 [bioreactor metagenome]|uniref:Uncharacterized protein n=1 Tax=bioreactor metagenome TaxID=1076179 RepID=A0A645IVI4_9ZZZZ